MKRVVAFLDVFDTIPDNSKYLYSNIFVFDPDAAEEQKDIKILFNSSDSPFSAKKTIYLHYYEVEEIDFATLVEDDFFNKTTLEKIKNFINEYKAPNKADDKD